jgi:hypothetical protein
MAVFWVVAPYSAAEGYRRFGGACCHHQGIVTLTMTLSISEMSVNFSRRHGAATQEEAIFMFVSMRTRRVTNFI